MTTPTRPIVRYHGGKWRLAPWIIEAFPAHRVYVEPFGGGGSVLLRKPRSYAEVYNDLDEEIVNVFRVLRDPSTAAQLTGALALTPFARVEFEGAYEPTDDPIERARRTIIRAFMGFGSAGVSAKHRTGFHHNTTRSGTTPAGDWRRYPEQIAAFCDRLQGVVIDCRPALDLLRTHDGPETLFYVDPPYVHTTRTRASTGRAYAHEMTDADHVALAEALSRVRGHVVLSGYDSPLYRDLYAGWERRDKATRGDSAVARVETLWLRSAA